MRTLLVLAAACGLSLAAASPVAALTTQECSTKYQAAKTAGTLNGMGWNDFRKAQCLEAAQPAAATAPATAPKAPATTAAAPAPAATGPAVFPKAVNPTYSTQSAGKQRQQTCLDQYKANETTGGNGGLKWIQKGGGYYSQCNKRLKGQA